MNFSSAKVDNSIISLRQAEFVRASSSFQESESIFKSVNSTYLSSEDSYLIKQFEQNLAETAYSLVQGELSRLRLKEQSVDKTDLVTTSNIAKHESILALYPEIAELDGKISSNKSEIAKYQQELNSLKATPEAIKYEALGKEITALQNTASGIVDLIALKASKGQDTSLLDKKLDEIKKEIEKKEQERAELQPQCEEMIEVEQKLEALLSENVELVNERMALDPQLVRFNKVDNFFSTIVQGNGNGLGVEADLEEYRDELSGTQEKYEDKSLQATDFQEILNSNLSLRNAVKSDLDSSRSIRELKQNIFSQVSP
jgi:hypothetical protein